MGQVGTEVLQEMFINAAKLIVEKEPYLTEIDSVIGDGDHGSGMKRGFLAVEKLLEGRRYRYADELCQAVSMELIKTMGGASGVIFGTMFFGGISHMPHCESVSTEELAEWLYEGEQAIERRGKAKPGQKTMLDALYPAVCAIKDSAQKGKDTAQAFEDAHQAALRGAEASKELLPKTGRSKNFRQKAIGYPDPGAVSTGYLFQAFAETLRKKSGEGNKLC